MHRWVDLLILAGFCFIFLALAKKKDLTEGFKKNIG
jgi:hypothetical protein